MAMDKIVIRGARAHNLKNVNVTIPKNKLVVMTGLSGSGKSSLAFDTLYAEGQRRYVESLSSYARQFLGQMDKPDVDSIDGLSPAISIDQKTTSKNPRSTVGTVTEINDYFRLLWARVGVPICPNDGSVISSQSVDQMIDQIMKLPERTKLQILSPIVRGKKVNTKRFLKRSSVKVLFGYRLMAKPMILMKHRNSIKIRAMTLILLLTELLSKMALITDCQIHWKLLCALVAVMPSLTFWASAIH